MASQQKLYRCLSIYGVFLCGFFSLFALSLHNALAKDSEAPEAASAQENLPQDPTTQVIVKRIAFYDEKIEELEKLYLKLSPRTVFHNESGYIESFDTPENVVPKDYKKGTSENNFSNFSGKKDQYKINKFIHAENCFIGTAIEIQDRSGKIVKYEEGPIDLRKASALNPVPYVAGQSLGYLLSFDTRNNDFPELYFESAAKQGEAYNIIDRLMQLCRERTILYRSIYPQDQAQALDLKVPPPQTPLGRVVRSGQEDPTMRGALLINGTKAFAARLKISEEATKEGDSILLQYLIFMADEAGIRLTDEVIKKAQDGVRVEVIIDALSPFFDVRDLTTRENTIKMYHNLMAAGIPVHGYRCGLLHHRLIDEAKLSLKYKKSIYDHRPHEKFWIVNGKKAVVGGMNIGNDYFRLNERGFGYWRDQDILIEGKEIIQDMVNVFEGNTQTYRNNYLDPREDTCFNRFHPVRERHEYQKFLMTNTKAYTLVRVRESKQDYQAHARAEIKRIEHMLRDNDPEIAFKFESLKYARLVHNLPKLNAQHTDIEDTYLSLINNARKEIIVSNAYFIPSENLKKSLRRAAKRGVKITILTNSYEANDVPPVAILARNGYKELVDYNYGKKPNKFDTTQEISLYEWAGRKEGSATMEMGTNHAKFIVVDRKIAFIGSYNLDPRSRNINSEVGIVFESEAIANRLAEEVFGVDLQYSRKINYRQILAFRKPIHILQGIYLKLKGYNMEDGIVALGKKAIFYDIAKYNEGTW